MGPKKKKPSSVAPEEKGDKLKEIDLKTVAWEKSFNVILLLPEDEQSNETLSSIIDSASGYQIPLTFINRDDVISTSLVDCTLPESLDSIVASDDLSWLTKLRLVEALHVNRLRREREIERSKTLETDLKALTRDCYREKKTRANAARSDATLVHQEQQDPQAETEQIVFDDDLLCHVWTYALYGFDDIGFLKSLIVDFNVPIVAIVKVKLTDVDKTTESPNPSEKDTYADQCVKLDESYFQSYLQNTGIMTFSSSSIDPKQILEELIYTTKFITDLKLMHLHYVRHLQILRPESTYPLSPLGCLHTYESMLDSISSALRTPALVLSGLLEELLQGKHEGKERKARRAGVKCRDPCALRSVFGRVPRERPVVHRHPTYLFHEADKLNMALKFDRASAPVLFDLTAKIWKIGGAFRDMDDVPIRRVLHKHDRNPSDEDAAICLSEKQQHMTMILLFALLDSQFEEPPEESTDESFAELLDVYKSQELFDRLSKTPLPPSFSWMSSNTYEVGITEFIWAEDLPSDALIQEITQAQRDYSYFKRKYSDELDGYLYIFSDELDDSGISIDWYDVTLSTVPNLRDFSRYVVVERNDWLKNNPTPTYKRETGRLETGCEMFVGLYPEYEALLTRASSSSSVSQPPSIPSSVPFGDILKDVQEYPSVDGLEAECGKECPLIPAYDTKRRFISVKGLRTTFYSHDGVKLIVDNTGFVDEEPKCSVNLISEGFRLVLHSGKALLKEDYAFQLFFDGDDSFVTFSFPSSTPLFSSNPTTKVEDEFSEDESKDEKPYDDLPELEKLTETKVKCAFKSAIEDLDLESEEKLPLDVGHVLRAAVEAEEEENVQLFKVEADVKYVEAVDPPEEVPLGDVIRRIVEASVVEEARDDFIKRYVPVGSSPRSRQPNRDSPDFRITLRDGLYVSCYRARPDDVVEIKQEHLGDFPEGHVGSREEFRLFTRAGTVLIKRLDGNIVILRSNGDRVLLERPDGDDLPVKKCRCKKPSDYKRKLKKLFKWERKEQKSDGTKRGYIPSDVLEVMTSCKIPYKKISIVNFEGMKTSLTGNKVSQKRHCVGVAERDHSSEEVFYERSDGLKCKTTRQSQYTVWFPDGTKITSKASMRAELVDGFVFVSLKKTYEHPEYVPVTYDEEDNLSLTLPNDVILTKSLNNVVRCTSGAMTAKVKVDEVKFIRTCPDCEFQYNCSFNIVPLVTKTMEDTTARFVSSLDSYGKKFYSDFTGVCEINPDFITSPINLYGCNHTNGNVYKKLFFVKRNLTGKQLWTTDMIESKKKHFTGEIVPIPECDALKFLTQVYRPTPERPSLTKSSSEPPEPELSHSTYRTLRKIVDVDLDVRPFFQHLSAKLEEYRFPVERIVEVVDDIAADMERAAAVREAEERVEVVDEKVCECEKVSISVEEKVEKWRREREKCWEMIRSGKVEKYFDSEFCRVVE